MDFFFLFLSSAPVDDQIERLILIAIFLIRKKIKRKKENIYMILIMEINKVWIGFSAGQEGM
jgi:hypothetical protein